MDSFDPSVVAQFLLGSDGAAGKKHYHWHCNCALHTLQGQCGHSSGSSTKVVLGKKGSKSSKGVLAKSSSSQDLAAPAAASLRESSRRQGQGSMGNLLELLDPRRSQEEIRRVAAKKEPL